MRTEFTLTIAVVFWLSISMLSALAQTQEYGVQRATAVEVDVQFKTSGVDAEYVHGEHCIDGRTF